MLRKTFEDGSPMANVPFLIVALDEVGEEIESHVMVTDENGILDTSANRENRTNSLDIYEEYGRFTDSSALDPYTGVWFGSSEPDDKLGALPYGMYKLYELQTEELKNKAIDLQETDILDINEPNVTVQLPEMVNRSVHVRSAAKSDGDQYMTESGDISVEDTVIMENLTPGRTYRVITDFVLRSDPNVLLGTAEEIITPEQELRKGTKETEVTLETQIDTQGLAGEAVVAVDRIYEQIHGEELLITEHNDLKDMEQTLWIPEIKTRARDAVSGKQEIQGTEEMRIIDTVEYKGLKPGAEYLVTGVIVDKETGDIIGEDQNLFAGIGVTFTPGGENGTVDVIYEIDGTDLIGRTLVCYEYLYLKEDTDKPLASHEDINDDAQSVSVIQIGTQARDTATGTHTAQWNRNEEITDTVSYKGLTPYKVYTLEGQIYVRSTGGILIQNGEAVKAEIQFIPQEPDGEIELTFTVDTEALQGQSLVVFEHLYSGEKGEEDQDKPIAVHEDLNDEDQTIKVPLRPREIVNTGDNETICLWASLGILAFSALGFVVRIRRKSKREQK